MFLKFATKEVSYFLKRAEWSKYFDEYNVTRKTAFYIKKVEKKINDKNGFLYFKYWVLWRWVNMNFKLTEWFIFNLKRNIKKMNLILSSKEERFILEIEELIFNSWRPLKQLPVKFELGKREKINLVQTNVNIYNFDLENMNQKITKVGKFDLYFSNKNLFLTNSDQIVRKTINYDDIKSVKTKLFGVIIETVDDVFLFKGKNKLLTYSLLERMVPRLKLSLEKVDKLYDYFDFWNQLNKRIN